MILVGFFNMSEKMLTAYSYIFYLVSLKKNVSIPA